MRRIKYINPNNAEIIFDYSPYLITSLDGLDLANLTIQEQKSPFQDGSVSIDRLFEPREISMAFSIESFQNFAQINTYKRAIVNVLNPKLGPGILQYSNDNGTWQNLKVTPMGPVFGNKDYMSPWQTGRIVFYCEDPYWYDLTETEVSMQAIAGGLTFPMTFTAGGITLSNYTAYNPTIQNSGDWTAPIKIEMIGACLNPVLTKTTTGEYLKILKNMSAGDVIEIDTTPGNKTVYFTASGGSRVNGINLLDTASTFFSLDPGENVLTFSDDTPSSTKQCFVRYTQRYIGV